MQRSGFLATAHVPQHGRGYDQKRKAAHDTRAQGPHEGVAARKGEQRHAVSRAVHGPVPDGRGKRGAGADGHVAEEDGEHGAPGAHGRDALRDGVHHEKVVGVGDAEGDGEKDEGAFHGEVLSSVLRDFVL